MLPKYTSKFLQLFWKKVAITANDNLCWEWQANKVKGYGHVKVANKLLYAHRVSWELIHGEIPQGMKILHSCDNPSCVNPKHLILGTQLDNIKDRQMKQRQARGEHHGCTKLTDEQVENIRIRIIGMAGGGMKRGDIYRILADEYNVSHHHISSIAIGRAR